MPGPNPDSPRRAFLLRCRGQALPLDPCRPRIMGILNITPDSFSDGGRFASRDAALEHALSMIRDGADLIDIGGESTRPGSLPVPDHVQVERVVPVVESIRSRSDILISVDTTRSAVASAAIAAGAQVVNDTSALGDDPLMAGTVRETGAAVVLMHRQGVPATMQDAPSYEAFMPELLEALGGAIAKAEQAGIRPDRILVDPGIGFGKRFEDNIEIHRSLGRLHSLGKPILFGSSRKSFLGRLSASPEGPRLAGTIASNVIAAWLGAHILRVHDVAEIREAVALVGAIRSAEAC
jgi:dihydropteroate synthase